VIYGFSVCAGVAFLRNPHKDEKTDRAVKLTTNKFNDHSGSISNEPMAYVALAAIFNFANPIMPLSFATNLGRTMTANKNDVGWLISCPKTITANGKTVWRGE